MKNLMILCAGMALTSSAALAGSARTEEMGFDAGPVALSHGIGLVGFLFLAALLVALCGRKAARSIRLFTYWRRLGGSRRESIGAAMGFLKA